MSPCPLYRLGQAFPVVTVRRREPAWRGDAGLTVAALTIVRRRIVRTGTIVQGQPSPGGTVRLSVVLVNTLAKPTSAAAFGQLSCPLAPVFGGEGEGAIRRRGSVNRNSLSNGVTHDIGTNHSREARVIPLAVTQHAGQPSFSNWGASIPEHQQGDGPNPAGPREPSLRVDHRQIDK